MTEKKTYEQFRTEVLKKLHKGLIDGPLNMAQIENMAANKFAAQELSEYKARLKKRIRDWNSTSIEEVPPSYSWKDIFELIDTV